ncbi:MAG TPA: GNAT family protein [Bacillota bacterium]|nr:GNAT family protein [Bacillota bacterium]HOH10724.1 GNAT family protein [Bacillota bacterium]HOS50791.1 GNAT family protein [Bacillota bacterium]HOY88528.1 GNAT family protein [Bacillota bacterium]HPI01500.1 GNAT family protein [Bacillota bacterium]
MGQFVYVDPGIPDDGTVELLLDRYTEDVDKARSFVPFYEFKVALSGTGKPVGGIVLRVGYNDHVIMCAGHIGYGIDEPFRGNGYASRAVVLLADFARKLKMPQLVITTRPDNEASMRTAEKAGFRFAGQARVPEHDEMYAEGERIMNRYVLDL